MQINCYQKFKSRISKKFLKDLRIFSETMSKEIKILILNIIINYLGKSVFTNKLIVQ